MLGKFITDLVGGAKFDGAELKSVPQVILEIENPQEGDKIWVPRLLDDNKGREPMPGTVVGWIVVYLNGQWVICEQHIVNSIGDHTAVPL